MIKNEHFDFLQTLEKNNNREWFADHKETFLQLDKEAKSFFRTIYMQLEQTDSLEKLQFYRIYKDVRFSKDKTPYNKHLSASFIRTKPLLRGGYYLRIENNASMIGGGFWEPNPTDLLRIRKEIELDATEIREIITDKKFTHFFGDLQGEEVKTAPKGFDKNHKNIDLIRKKQFLVIRNFTNNEVLSANFAEQVLVTFLAMRPFFDYMSNVLTTNLNGESLFE